MSEAIEAAAKSSLRPLWTALGSSLGCVGTAVPGGTSCQAENTMVHSPPSAPGGMTSAAEMPAAAEVITRSGFGGYDTNSRMTPSVSPP
jgi:hypothetical protein